MNYTYMLQCSDDTFYIGWTNNLEKRIEAHNEGKGAKYTKGRLPVKLVYFETFATKEEAMSREWHLKKLSKAEKMELLNNIEKEKSMFKEIKKSKTKHKMQNTENT